MKNEVNWSLFDINPFDDDDKDVSRSQVLDEFAKYDGNADDFVDELADRCNYSGAMCDIVRNWINNAS